MGARVIIPGDERVIIESYLDGLSMRQLGEKYNCCHETIRQIIAKSGTVRSTQEGATIRRRGFIPIDVEDAIVDAYLDRVSPAELTEWFGVTYPTILRIVRDRGATINRKLAEKLTKECSVCKKEITRPNWKRPATKTGKWVCSSECRGVLNRQLLTGKTMPANRKQFGLPPILTIDDIKTHLRIGRNQVYDLVNTGKLPSFRIGTQIRVRRDSLLEWMAAGGEK